MRAASAPEVSPSCTDRLGRWEANKSADTESDVNKDGRMPTEIRRRENGDEESRVDFRGSASKRWRPDCATETIAKHRRLLPPSITMPAQARLFSRTQRHERRVRRDIERLGRALHFITVNLDEGCSRVLRVAIAGGMIKARARHNGLRISGRGSAILACRHQRK